MSVIADSTGHKAINYTSRHINLEVEDYKLESGSTKRATRFLGITPSLDGTSEELLKDYDKVLMDILNGLQSDHCAKEKKDSWGLEFMKLEALHTKLGEDHITKEDTQTLLPQFLKAHKQMIHDHGGEENWDKLSEDDQAGHSAKMLSELVKELGRETYDLLSEEEQRTMSLFIWAGCGCHKDLNTVRGGYMAVIAWWKENQTFTPPVLLANQDNAAVLKGVGEGDDVENFTFPDTSNTRYGSYCEAAIVLVLHQDAFIKFLDFVQLKKHKYRFSHMEENFYNGLHCKATLTELAVLGLYAQAVSYPYMARIHNEAQKKTNMLDLGPFHAEVYNHIQKLAAYPELLTDGPANCQTACLEGKEWRSPDFMSKMAQLSPTLPHLRDLFVAFAEGAAVTWKRFTSEFAPGGLIDEASQEEHDLAWMLPTNDMNEGALGAFRLTMRRQPQLSLLGYNSQAMKYFKEPEDFKFLHKLARENYGEDQKCQIEIMEHAQMRAKEKEKHRQKRANTQAEKVQKIEGTAIILGQDELEKLKGEALKTMVDVFKNFGAPGLDVLNSKSKVNEKREALKEAARLYHLGNWSLPVDDEDGGALSDDEIVDEMDENSDWESDRE
ncbi:hypothetical protein FA15DRAFT_678043 [Coprinopsis marcescibilis]|uniref:Uncharacterized protein n=1 Tax=Coprinopsis marcescibilis TaxID=230819 RepID=A0A5C3LB04_COPMA|nr:hypothetical protein FA15DRAFT_678043 [Coprinopsis marcescibilis]